MYVAFTSPHWPLHAPEETVAKYNGRYDAGYEPVRAARYAKMQGMGLISSKWELSPAPPPAPPTTAPWETQANKAWESRCMEVYAAQVDRMDQNVGKILAALRESGQYENTLILFLSDNGGCAEPMGRFAQPERWKATTTRPMRSDEIQVSFYPRFTRDGRPIRNGPATMPGGDASFVAYGQNWANVSNTPFREYKHWVHEGGISTPLIAHWPGMIKRRGELERQPGHVIDLMATCVDLAGATYPREFAEHRITPMQGVSLAPAFFGQDLGRKSPIFFEHEGNRAVREGEWKLVAKGINGKWELYDMEADRTEMHDLASQEAQRVEEMAERWQRWAQTSNVLPLNPWQRRKGK
jgi:arylsulfatase